MTTGYEPPKSDLVTDAAFGNPPLFSPRGRIGRVRLLAHKLWLGIATGLAMVIGSFALGEALAGAVTLLVVLASTVLTVILYIKRSHDMNMSGALAVLLFIPLVNLFFVFVPGTKGSNTYGPEPAPNTPLLWIGAIIYPLLFGVGILAAVGIPAYQDYTARAQVGAGFALAEGPRAAIGEYFDSRGDLPGYAALASMQLDEPIEGQYAQLSVEPDTGIITVTMCAVPECAAPIAGKSFRFTPVVDDTRFEFSCRSDDIEARFLPRSCVSN